VTVANLAEAFPGMMDVNRIGDMVVEGERDVREVLERKGRREGAKRELTAIVEKHRYCRAIMDAASVASKGQFTSNDLDRLLPDRVVLAKDDMQVRMERLKQIVKESTPDEIPIFHPDEYGLDFSFDALLPHPP